MVVATCLWSPLPCNQGRKSQTRHNNEELQTRRDTRAFSQEGILVDVNQFIAVEQHVQVADQGFAADLSGGRASLGQLPCDALKILQACLNFF